MRPLALACLLLMVRTAFAAEPAPPPTDAEQQAKLLEIAQEKLKATFQSFQFDEIKASDIPGIVEIYGGGRIFYYAPKQELLLIGEMYTANGLSLTEQKLSQRAAAAAAGLDRSSAVVIGEGPRELIAFVDPDCGYCRASYRWLVARESRDAKVLLYFTALSGRPAAEAKALEVLCAGEQDRSAALKRAFDPAPTDRPNLSVRCAEGVAALEQHAALAKKLGVYATPFFLAGGQVIAGFNRDKLDAYLGGTASDRRSADAAIH